MTERPTSGRLRPLFWIVCLSVVAALLSGCGPSRSQAQETASPTPTPQPQRVPVTVEVTRLVMSERIVPATPTPPQRCTPDALASAPTMTIGAVLPLSQASTLSSVLGTQTALALAVDAINGRGGAGGRPVRLWLGDAGSSAAQAHAAVVQAIAEQCAVALVASLSGETGTAILEAAHEHGVPLIAIEGSDDGLTATGYPEIFRLAPTNSMMATTYADWLEAVGDYNGDGRSSTTFVVEESSSQHQQVERIGSELTARGISYDVYAVDLPRDDFSSLIARLVVREEMPDAIFIRFNGDSATALHRQLLENGIGPAKSTLIVAMRNALNHDSFWPAFGDNGALTIVARTGPWPTTVGDEGREFGSAFDFFLGRWPEAPAFAAYDSIFLIADALQRAGSTESGALIDALGTSNATLAGGVYSFPYGRDHPPQRNGQPAWAWHQWMDPPLLFLQYTGPNQPSASMAVLWPPEYATVPEAVVRLQNPPQ